VGATHFLHVKNTGGNPVTINKITLNKKYTNTKLLDGANAVDWRPITLKSRESITIFHPDDCPNPTVVEVGTDQGSASYHFDKKHWHKVLAPQARQTHVPTGTTRSCEATNTTKKQTGVVNQNPIPPA